MFSDTKGRWAVVFIAIYPKIFAVMEPPMACRRLWHLLNKEFGMILIAEDNLVNQIVIQQMLADTGYDHALVENGKLAVEFCKTHKPDLVLMDISMPEMNGLDATKAIRSIEKETADRIVIIAVTAHAADFDRNLCMEVGMDDFMSKPLSMGRVIEMLDSWLGG